MLRSRVRSLARCCAALPLLHLFACASAPTMEGRLIQRAEVDVAAVPKTLPGDRLASAVRLLAAGHFLRAGEGSVLQLYRQRVDEESGQRAMELLTIGVPAKHPRGRLDLRDKKLVATYSYSAGGDALEAHGRSLSMEGFVTVQTRGSGVLVELEADALLAGGLRRRLSWNAQIPGTAVYDFRAWPSTTWTEGFWFLERDAGDPAAKDAR
ncbi:MAG: hypothetical protein JNM84_18970 [Planctomycetes bacterium]|nr:hypothetical protein [Planctomycetota bacterium]